MIFKNRTEAGGQLAAEIQNHPEIAEAPDLIVLGLPRGGVAVALEVAKALHAPLDLFMVRKIGAPEHEELAMGAVASGGILIRNESVLRFMNIPEDIFQGMIQREQAAMAACEIAYRGSREPLKLQGQSVILVDDGLATGASMKAAIDGVQAQSPRSVVVAVPVAARQTCDEIRPWVDDLICLNMPHPFYGVGQWYYDFSQTTTEEVQAMLEENESHGMSHGHDHGENTKAAEFFGQGLQKAVFRGFL